MTTTTAPAHFLTKCPNGHVERFTDAERVANTAAFSCNKWGMTKCAICRRAVGFKPIKVRITDTECGPRCTGATGPSCDCKCGGENHAGGHR